MSRSKNYQEIKEVRSRLSSKNWEYALFDIHDRFRQLEPLIGTELGKELHRHVIVSAIATLQTFHCNAIITIADAGSEYRVRAVSNIKEKFSLEDALMWINGGDVSLSEFVAHQASCNSVPDLMLIAKLLDQNIVQLLSEAVNPYDLRNKVPSPVKIVPDVDSLLSNLAEAFRLRHIFAHEAASREEITAERCRELFLAIVQWVDALNAIFWVTIYKDTPLTQYEMNIDARNQVSQARDRLAKLLRTTLSKARAEGKASWLRQNHFSWMKSTTEWLGNTYGSLDGTMWPAVYGANLAGMINNRIAQIEDWNNVSSL